jgi:ComF family protein
MARALGCYEGSLQKIIHRWKYQGKASVTPYLGEWIAERFYRYWNPHVLDLLVPVPLHRKRLRERGFNQALLLARELSHRTQIPYQVRILQKKRATPPQVQLNGEEREKGIKGAFHITHRDGMEGKTILLIDDVYTTGATVNECSKVLIRGGAKRVDVLTLAHTMKNS